MGLSSVIVPYASYLRVYEPLAAFPEPERAHWKRYAAAGAPRTAQDELRQSLADLVPMPPVPVPVHESRDAFVAVVDGVVHVCPWRTRLRGWLALEELADQLPAPVLDAVLPAVVRRQAAADYERWRERNPDARPWIRSATWHVPVRWFVLFDDSEREYEPGAGAGSSPDSSGEADKKQAAAPVLRYRTAMVQARRRVARALRVLRDNLDESAADRRPGGRRPVAGGVPPALAGRAGLRRSGARDPGDPAGRRSQRGGRGGGPRGAAGRRHGRGRRGVRAAQRALARGARPSVRQLNSGSSRGRRCVPLPNAYPGGKSWSGSGRVQRLVPDQRVKRDREHVSYSCAHTQPSCQNRTTSCSWGVSGTLIAL